MSGHGPAGRAEGPAVVMPSSRAELAVRVVVLVAMLGCWALAAGQPARGDVVTLIGELELGRVDTLVLDQPAGVDDGTFAARWSVDGTTSVARYVAQPEADWGARIRDAARLSPAWVHLSEAPVPVPVPATRLLRVLSLAALGVLMLGSETRLATTAGWFFVTAACTPLWIAFLVLEPTPLWARRPVVGPRQRLGGPFAFAVAVALAVAGFALAPGAFLLLG